MGGSGRQYNRLNKIAGGSLSSRSLKKRASVSGSLLRSIIVMQSNQSVILVLAVIFQEMASRR